MWLNWYKGRAEHFTHKLNNAEYKSFEILRIGNKIIEAEYSKHLSSSYLTGWSHTTLIQSERLNVNSNTLNQNTKSNSLFLLHFLRWRKQDVLTATEWSSLTWQRKSLGIFCMLHSDAVLYRCLTEMCINVFPETSSVDLFLIYHFSVSQKCRPLDNITTKVQKQLQKNVLTVNVQRIGHCQWL